MGGGGSTSCEEPDEKETTTTETSHIGGDVVRGGLAWALVREGAGVACPHTGGLGATVEEWRERRRRNGRERRKARGAPAAVASS
jgi:hypothetical protein